MKYKCAYCGKEYDDIESRMTCEERCNKKHVKEIAVKRREELAKKKADRYKEVTKLYGEAEKACAKYSNAIEQYNKDYNPDSIWNMFGIE